VIPLGVAALGALAIVLAAALAPNSALVAHGVLWTAGISTLTCSCLVVYRLVRYAAWWLGSLAVCIAMPAALVGVSELYSSLMFAGIL